MDLDSFAEIGDKIKYYVYILVDPDTHKIFYVGKGKKDRVFDHTNEVKKKLKNNDAKITSEKEKKIADIILRTKQSPLMYIIRYNLEENEAFLIESVLIDLLNKGVFNLPQLSIAGIEMEPDTLSNIQGGHSMNNGSISTVKELYQIMGSKPIDLDNKTKRAIIPGQSPINLLIAKLPSYRGTIKSDDERRIRTKGNWPLGRRRIDNLIKQDNDLYIAAAEDGIITAVYKINKDNVKWIMKDDPSNNTKSERVNFDITLLSPGDPISKELIGKNVFFNKSQFPVIYCC